MVEQEIVNSDSSRTSSFKTVPCIKFIHTFVLFFFNNNYTLYLNHKKRKEIYIYIYV